MPSEIAGDVVVPNKNGGLIIITTPMKTIKAKMIFQRLCRWPRTRNVRIRVKTGLEKMIARALPIGILRTAK